MKDQTTVDAAKAKRAEEARKRIAAIKASFKKGQKSDITFEAGFFKVNYLSSYETRLQMSLKYQSFVLKKLFVIIHLGSCVFGTPSVWKNK